MERRLPLDAVDPRTIFVAYAAVVGASGVCLIAWGSLWLGGPLLGNPWGLNTVVRVAGAVVVAAACCAMGCGQVKDPGDRRQALKWFLLAHTVVLAVAVTQAAAVWSFNKLPTPFYWGIVAVAVLWTWLLGGWMRQGGDPAPFSSHLGLLRGSPTAVERQQSEYEHQLRVAGAEEERRRFARDLHDSVKQQLFAIQTAAATADTRFDADAVGAREAIERVRDAARDAMAEMEALIDQLQVTPRENTSLIDGLRKLCEACELRTGTPVRFTRGPLPPSEAWPAGSHEAVYRVTQEALANVARHARAAHVSVALTTTADIVTVEIRDDGSGFTPDRAGSGMGLENLRQRATEVGGSVTVESRPGHGTMVRFSLDCSAEAPTVFLRRAVFSCTVIVFLMFAVLTAHGNRVNFLILMAPAALDVARYLYAWYRARQLQGRPA
jgi:signal transduction histidine kinase